MKKAFENQDLIDFKSEAKKRLTDLRSEYIDEQSWVVESTKPITHRTQFVIGGKMEGKQFYFDKEDNGTFTLTPVPQEQLIIE